MFHHSPHAQIFRRKPLKKPSLIDSHSGNDHELIRIHLPELRMIDMGESHIGDGFEDSAQVFPSKIDNSWVKDFLDLWRMDSAMNCRL